MNFLDKVIEIIKEKEEKIDTTEFAYHVYLKDAHVLVYLDEESTTLKVEVEMFDEGRAKVFFSDSKLEDLM